MKKQFTLVELVVVMVMLALLAVMALPALSHAEDAAVETGCKGNLKQIGAASALYSEKNADYFCLWKCPGKEAWMSRLWSAKLDEILTGERNYNGMMKSPVFRCPAAEGIDNSMNLGYSTPFHLGQSDDGVTYHKAPNGLPCKPQTRSQVKDPANSVYLIDHTNVKTGYFCPGWTFYWDASSEMQIVPQASFRHDNEVNIGWVDGHVSSALKEDDAASGSFAADLNTKDGRLDWCIAK